MTPLPLFVLWDDVISVLRTYTTKEPNQMISEFDQCNLFDWEVGLSKGKPSQILYLIGIPKIKQSSSSKT